jgi:hypothetical protein
MVSLSVSSMRMRPASMEAERKWGEGREEQIDGKEEGT